jgi:hypothetical protein
MYLIKLCKLFLRNKFDYYYYYYYRINKFSFFMIFLLCMYNITGMNRKGQLIEINNKTLQYLYVSAQYNFILSFFSQIGLFKYVNIL